MEQIKLTADERQARAEYRRVHRTDEARARQRAYKRAWNKAHPEKWREYQKRFFAKLVAERSSDHE